MNYMHPPIFLCETGHNYCRSCFNRLSHCPTCGAPKKQTRNFTMERLWHKVVLPCTNADNGCDVMARGPDVLRHQLKCVYQPSNCPYKHIDGCTWIGCPSEFETHLIERHQETIWHNFSTVDIRDIMSPCRTLFHAVFYTDRELFYFCYQITNGQFKVCVIKLTNFTETDFKYRFVILRSDGESPALQYECPTSYMRNFNPTNISQYFCWGTAYIKEFADASGTISVTCTIIEKRNTRHMWMKKMNSLLISFFNMSSFFRNL